MPICRDRVSIRSLTGRYMNVIIAEFGTHLAHGLILFSVFINSVKDHLPSDVLCYLIFDLKA